MKCKYIYKGHIFNSEAALDDFLIEKHQYESKFGDIVFSKGKPFLRAKDIIENKIMKDAEKLQHKMKIIQARKRGDAFDDEEMLEFEKPFIGVNRFLSGLKTDEGDYIVLDFIVDNYWAKRKEFWTKPLETGEQVADRFTDDEIDIFFEADSLKTYSSKEEEFQAKKEKAHLLNDKECNQLKTLMSKKWGFQAKAGTAIHYVLEQYFSKDSEGKLIGDKSFTEIFDHIKANIDKDLSESLGDAIYKDFKDSIINDSIINQAIMYAESLKKELRRVHGECEFYPELTISHQLSKQKYGDNTNNILGIIDLAVIDEKGQIHYYDYKTSPKEFSKFNSAKKQAFQYQLAMYGKLLKKYGLDYRNSDIRILPVQFDNLRLANPGEAHINPNKAKFSYDGIKYSSNIFIDTETKNAIFKYNSKGEQPILDVLDDYLPEDIEFDVPSDQIIEKTEAQIKKWFPNYNRFKAKTEEEIKELLEESNSLTPVERNGKQVYVYTPKNGYGKEIVANEPIELIEKLKKQQERFEKNKEYMAGIVVKALRYGIENGTTDIASYIKSIDTKRVSEDTGLATWFQDTLKKYCNGNWEVADIEALKHFGVIVLRNKRNKQQIDVIKMTSSNLKFNPCKKQKNKLLSAAFQSDIAEKANPDSLMLEQMQGNIELMETLLLFNNIPELFSGEYSAAVLGNIQVANSFRGTGMSSPNEQLYYSFKKMSLLSPTDFENNILNGKVKIGTTFEIAANAFEEALEPESDFRLDTDTFNSARSELDEAVKLGDKDKKISAISNIIRKMEEVYPEFKNGLTREMLLQRPEARLYNQILQALAYLNNVNFKQQVDDHDKYIQEKSFKGIILKGLSGTYIDNPGNLLSDTLNTITNLVTQAYQNIRNKMMSKVAQLREATEELKRHKNYTGLMQIYGNATNMYENMTYESPTGDLLFTDLNSSKLDNVERKYLKLVLEIINENRFGGKKSKEELEQMRDSYNLEYYRVPLCKASAESRDSVIGLDKGLKERLSRFMPKNALAELKAQVEGIFVDDLGATFENSSQLFEMNNRFDRTESNHMEERLKAISINGAGFFERNLEQLTFNHTYAYLSAKELNKVFPLMKASLGFLQSMGNSVNKTFKNDVEYLLNYFKTAVKGQPLNKDEQVQKTIASLGKLKQVASFMALAFSPVQAMYQTVQGLWQDILLMIKNKNIPNTPFTFTNMYDAFKIVYQDLFHFHSTPTKCQLINEWLGVNDMDMNMYSERMRTDQYNKYNLMNFAFKFASRPDFYNRMTIIVAKMKADGIWDALEIVNGQLKYNWKKDKRFSVYANNQTSNPNYNNQRALYTSIAQQFILENTYNPDGTVFKMGDPLPYAWTNKEGESIKSLCDLIYGYYSHEKKSLVHATFIGSLYMQMKTYWSGKKNQYLAPGGVRLQGKWEHAKDEQGNLLYYQENPDGTINFNEKPTTKPNNSPFYKWQGLYQEGIILTLSNIFKNGISGKAIREGWNETWNNEDANIRMARQMNIKQFGADILFYLIISVLIAGCLMMDWDKDLQKKAKESKDLKDAAAATLVHLTRLSFGQSAEDFAWWQSIGNPAIEWSPFSFTWGTNTVKRIYNAIMGDSDFYDGVMQSSAAGKQIKPLMDYIKPEGINKKSLKQYITSQLE